MAFWVALALSVHVRGFKGHLMRIIYILVQGKWHAELSQSSQSGDSEASWEQIGMVFRVVYALGEYPLLVEIIGRCHQILCSFWRGFLY